MNKKTNNKKGPIVSGKVAAIGIVAIVFIVFILLCVVIRVNYTKQGWADALASAIGYPILVTVRPFSVLTASEVGRDMQSLRQFYESQDFASIGMRVDFTTEEGKNRLKVREKELLNKHIEDVVMESIVREHGEKVSLSEVRQRVDRKMKEFGNRDEVEKELGRLYGWDIKDFEKNVVQVELYQEKALEIFNNRNDKSKDEDARRSIEKAKAALDGGAPFRDVVEKYSEGVEAENSGEVGWVLPAQTEPVIAGAIEGMVPGEVTDIVESSIGFHIIELEETRREEDGTFYRIRQIFTQKESFADWVHESIRKAWVFPMVSVYTWDRGSASVEFSDANMRAFEEDMVETIDVSGDEGQE